MMAMKKQCTQNFRGKASQSKLQIPVIQLYDLQAVPIPTAVGPILQKGLSQSKQIEVMDIELQPKLAMNNELKIASLVVKFRKVATGETYLRSLPMLLLVDPSNLQVKECWLRQDVSSIQQTQACMAASDGAINSYDPATNSCKLTNGKWYPGTSIAATCPAGTTLPRFPNSLYHCKADPPPGFDDAAFYAASSVPMASGASIPIGRAAVFTKIVPPNGCSCAIAVDIPQTTRDAFVCNAYCIGP